MQHDVFQNIARRSRAVQPFFVCLQADAVEGSSRIVCPLYQTAGLVPSKTLIQVSFDGRDWLLALEFMVSVPAGLLRRPVGSVAAYRDDILRALDWLFTGI